MGGVVKASESLTACLSNSKVIVELAKTMRPFCASETRSGRLS